MQERSDGNSFKDEDTGNSSYVIVLNITYKTVLKPTGDFLSQEMIDTHLPGGI